MASKLVTEAGYYNGKFLKAGMSYSEDGVSEGGKDVPHEVKLSSLNKEELIAEAKARGIEVDAANTKAEIIAAIEAGAAN